MRRCTARSALSRPEVIHHGLLVGADGKKLSKRADGATVASLREDGYPAEAVRAYLEELELPRHDVISTSSESDRSRSTCSTQLDDAELAGARRRPPSKRRRSCAALTTWSKPGALARPCWTTLGTVPGSVRKP